jgi:hypothetical protein
MEAKLVVIYKYIDHAKEGGQIMKDIFIICFENTPTHKIIHDVMSQIHNKVKSRLIGYTFVCKKKLMKEKEVPLDNEMMTVEFFKEIKCVYFTGGAPCEHGLHHLYKYVEGTYDHLMYNSETGELEPKTTTPAFTQVGGHYTTQKKKRF